MSSSIAALALAYIELMTQLDPCMNVNLEQAIPVLFSESIQKIVEISTITDIKAGMNLAPIRALLS